MHLVWPTNGPTLQMIKDNIESAGKVLDRNTEGIEISESEVNDEQKRAYETIEEVERNQEQAEDEMRPLALNLSSLAPAIDLSLEDTSEADDDAQIERKLRSIGKYQAERYDKMIKEIKVKMEFSKVNHLLKWEEQKDILDYQALKEIRSEFEGTHKKVRYMVSEWERRKFSDRLSDSLMDMIGVKFDEYD